MSGLVAIRVDGSHAIGMGHLFRMLVLAKEMRRAGVGGVLFLSRTDERANGLVREQGMELEIIAPGQEEIERVSGIVAARSPALLINDILDTSTRYMEAIRPLVLRIVNLDDAGPGRNWADVIVNSLPAKQCPPAEGERPITLDGPQYLLLGEEFQRRSSALRRISPTCPSILVTLGGSDTYGYSVKLVAALRKIGELEQVEVVAGPAFRHRDELERAAGDESRFVLHYSVPNLAALMERHGLAIVGGGITLFEAAALGLPTLAVASEDFEEKNISWGQERGFTCFLGRGRQLDEEGIIAGVQSLLGNPQKRRAMSECGPRVVDGQGRRRMAELVLSLMAAA